jgi:hypothetical protein
MSVLNKQFN